MTAMGSMATASSRRESDGAPRSTRTLKTQEGRHLRRHERRWLVERFFAWLQWKRRLLIRGEYYASNFLGFVQLACMTMLLKQF